jgi:hypothetical protein
VKLGRSVVLVVAAGIVAVAIYRSSPEARRLVGAECTVGGNQVQATLTIDGFGARQACDQLVAQYASELFLADGPSSLPVLCRYDRGNLTYTVRDTGIFLIAGRSMCAAVAVQPSPS